MQKTPAQQKRKPINPVAEKAVKMQAQKKQS